jgi:hypothetical protein
MASPAVIPCVARALRPGAYHVPFNHNGFGRPVSDRMLGTAGFNPTFSIKHAAAAKASACRLSDSELQPIEKLIDCARRVLGLKLRTLLQLQSSEPVRSEKLTASINLPLGNDHKLLLLPPPRTLLQLQSSELVRSEKLTASVNLPLGNDHKLLPPLAPVPLARSWTPYSTLMYLRLKTWNL